MRNNEERLSTHHDSSLQPALSPLEFVVPTSFVELPSKGQFYPEGHPLHNQETIEIKEMTAKEEDILTSKALIEKGLAVERLLDSIIVDKSIDSDSLLVGDKNAIIIQARVSAYGPDYKVSVSCPACGEGCKHEFSLSDIENTEALYHENVERLPNNNIIIKLNNGWQVECKMITGKDEKKLVKQSEMKKKKKVPESPLTDMLNAIIVSVSGHADAETIQKAVGFMPAKDTRLLREAYQAAIPNVDMTQLFTCPSCDHMEDLEVPLSAEFFWPK